jgi:hypothetical protein
MFTRLETLTGEQENIKKVRQSTLLYPQYTSMMSVFLFSSATEYPMRTIHTSLPYLIEVNTSAFTNQP